MLVEYKADGAHPAGSPFRCFRLCALSDDNLLSVYIPRRHVHKKLNVWRLVAFCLKWRGLVVESVLRVFAVLGQPVQHVCVGGLVGDGIRIPGWLRGVANKL